jgi:hypothetical protein
MADSTQTQQRAWIAQWRRAEVALARVKHAELLGVDLARVADELDHACLASLTSHPPRPTSGLIE